MPLRAAAQGLLSGRAPARDRVLSVVAERWVAVVVNDYGFDDVILDLLGIEADDTKPGVEVPALYETADGPNRTKIVLASVLAEMLDQVGGTWLDEKTDPTFKALVDVLTDLGAEIDIDGFPLDETAS